MRHLDITHIPTWLAPRTHLYPSINDFEVATKEKCNSYWIQQAGQKALDTGVNTASVNLCHLITNNGVFDHDSQVYTHANSYQSLYQMH